VLVTKHTKKKTASPNKRLKKPPNNKVLRRVIATKTSLGSLMEAQNFHTKLYYTKGIPICTVAKLPNWPLMY
jgi:hypothetical protein